MFSFSWLHYREENNREGADEERRGIDEQQKSRKRNDETKRDEFNGHGRKTRSRGGKLGRIAFFTIRFG